MTISIRLSELAKLPDSEKRDKLAALVASRKQPEDESLAAVNERISAFETRYEMASSTMLSRVLRGEIRETADICHWMMLLDAKERLVRDCIRERENQ